MNSKEFLEWIYDNLITCESGDDLHEFSHFLYGKLKELENIIDELKTSELNMSN